MGGLNLQPALRVEISFVWFVTFYAQMTLQFHPNAL